jgi:hypothetical protein
MIRKKEVLRLAREYNKTTVDKSDRYSLPGKNLHHFISSQSFPLPLMVFLPHH